MIVTWYSCIKDGGGKGEAVFLREKLRILEVKRGVKSVK
jgi:hypothetical protein